MPLSSIQHEWFRAPLDHAGLSATGASPDCIRYTLMMPSQSSFDGPFADAVAGLRPVTNAAPNSARPDIVAIHRRVLRAAVSSEVERVGIVRPCGWKWSDWRSTAGCRNWFLDASVLAGTF
jgi:hypothetical protein